MIREQLVNILKAVFIVALVSTFLIISCKCKIDQEDRAKSLMDKAIGKGKGNCISETGEYSEIAICTDGRLLVVCTKDSDHCLFVNLDPERPIK